jgi:hypothetical protein
MVDRTLCANSECQKFTECYRSQAKPNNEQYYFNGGLIIDENGCEYHVPFVRNDLQNSTNVLK